MNIIQEIVTHYAQTKLRYPECVLFWSVNDGSSYLLLDQDARIAARELRCDYQTIDGFGDCLVFDLDETESATTALVAAGFHVALASGCGDIRIMQPRYSVRDQAQHFERAVLRQPLVEAPDIEPGRTGWMYPAPDYGMPDPRGEWLFLPDGDPRTFLVSSCQLQMVIEGEPHV